MKKKIISYIADNYKYLTLCAKNITKDKNKADDLISCITLQFYDMKNIKGLEDAFKHNINGYIHRAMYYQFISKNSEYNKLYKNDYDEYIDNIEINDLIEDYDEERYNNILNQVQSNSSLTWYDKQVFELLYSPEKYIDINNMDKKEVDDLRKMSPRKLSKKTSINYLSLYFTSNKVIKTINIK